MTISPQNPLITLILLATIGWPMIIRADVDSANSFITGLRNLDSNLSAIKDKGLGTWLQDQVTDKTWEHIPDLFGNMSDTVKNLQTVGKDDYKLLSGSANVFTQSYGSFSSDPAQEDSQQAHTQFWDSLPDQQRDMGKDELQMTMPAPLKQLADKIQSFSDNAQWLDDKLTTASNATSDSAASISARIQGYVADVKSLGLEPGSPDYEFAATTTINGAPAFASASPADTATTNSDAAQSSASDASSAHPADSDAPSAPRTPDNDLASDLRSAGWDNVNSSAVTDSNSINADDLAGLSGNQSHTPSPSSSIDASQVQADLSDWDKQQATAQLAQAQEQARQAALAAQQQAADNAKRAQAERLAQEQADMEASNDNDPEPPPPPPERSTGTGFWNGVAQGASLTQQLLALKSGRAAGISGLSGISGSSGDCTPPAANNAVQQCSSAVGNGTCAMLRSYASCLTRAQTLCGSCGSCSNAIRAQTMSIQRSAAMCN